MKPYKFITRISEDGTIQIPYKKELQNKEVEVIIMPRTQNKNKETKATDFVRKWAGFLKDSETDKAKYDYLSSKYK